MKLTTQIDWRYWGLGFAFDNGYHAWALYIQLGPVGLIIDGPDRVL